MTPGAEVHRFKLTIHYDGTRFHGWQLQPEQRTVQGELEAAVERLTQQPRTVLGSGRTDAGVHATGQVAMVDVPIRWGPGELRKSLNAVLPRDIWVEAIDLVPPGFHARYHATARTYAYRLGLAERAFSPFHRPWCWALDEPVEPTRLHEAAALLPGERSFGAFAKSGQPHRGERCHVHAAGWSDWTDPASPATARRGGGSSGRPGEGGSRGRREGASGRPDEGTSGGLGLVFHITADRYLHRMVRYLVGTMVDVARGRRPLDEMAALVDRSDPELVTSAPAPPDGLFLVRVEYEAADHPDIATHAPLEPTRRPTPT